MMVDIPSTKLAEAYQKLLCQADPACQGGPFLACWRICKQNDLL